MNLSSLGRHAIADEQIENRELDMLRSSPDSAAFLCLPRGACSSDCSAIVGDGFIFIHAGSNRWASQLDGTDRISTDDFIVVQNVINEYKKQCIKRNIQLRFLVIPEKDIIYKKESPNMDAGLSDFRSSNIYKSCFEDILIYPASELIDAAKFFRTHHRRDSHCNFIGGFLIFNAVLRNFGLKPVDIDSIPTKHAPFVDDLPLKWYSKETLKRCIDIEFHEETHVFTGRFHGMHLEFTNNKSVSTETVFIFGDSYSWNVDAGLARFLGAHYRTVHFFWKKQIDWDLVDQKKPTAILLQSAERFLLKGVI